MRSKHDADCKYEYVHAHTHTQNKNNNSQFFFNLSLELPCTNLVGLAWAALFYAGIPPLNQGKVGHHCKHLRKKKIEGEREYVSECKQCKKINEMKER